MQDFWANFVANAGGAAIGAIAAFIFGIWLARIEFANERRERQNERRETDTLSLKAAIDSSWQNMEELLNLKGQIVVPLLQEVAELQHVMQENAANPGAWGAKVTTLPSYGKELQAPSFALTPSADRFGFAIDDAPAISSYLHRAASTVQNVSSSMHLRNELVRRFADTARGGSIKGSEMEYFFAMLNSYAQAIASNVDDALFFNHLLHDQSYYLGVEKFTRPTFRRVKFSPAKASLMPDEEYVPNFRKGMVTFGHPKTGLFD